MNSFATGEVTIEWWMLWAGSDDTPSFKRGFADPEDVGGTWTAINVVTSEGQLALAVGNEDIALVQTVLRTWIR